MIDKGNGSDGTANGLGNNDEIAERCATATSLDGASHTRGTEFDHLVPKVAIETEWFSSTSHRRWGFIGEEPIEQFGDGFLVGTESQINTH